MAQKASASKAAHAVFREMATSGIGSDAGFGSMITRSEGPAMKLVGPLVARTLRLRLAFGFEIERHCGADEILQCRLIDLVAFVNVDGAPDIPVEAGVEQTG